jgi:hypothetical protein
VLTSSLSLPIIRGDGLMSSVYFGTLTFGPLILVIRLWFLTDRTSFLEWCAYGFFTYAGWFTLSVGIIAAGLYFPFSFLKFQKAEPMHPLNSLHAWRSGREQNHVPCKR